MEPELKIPPKKQLKNLLLVLFFGIGSGLLIVVFLVNFYGPSGKYKAKNTLLAPETLEKLWYSDINPKTGGNSRFVFQKVEMNYPSANRSNWESKELTMDQYRKFYTLVENDISELKPSEEMMRFFDQDNLVEIVIKVKTESDAGWQEASKIFQKVQISPKESYYRVELHEDNIGIHWAYFYHPEIYSNLIKQVGLVHDEG